MKKKKRQYELVTSKTGFNMPYQVLGVNRKQALKAVKRRLRKNEKILSFMRVW